MSPLLNFATWLNDTPFSVDLREGYYAFPVIETIHILGLGFSVGIIAWVDLRLLGIAMRRRPVVDIIKQLEPVAIAGFVVMFVSGILLLLSEPLKCYTTLAFRLKVFMLLLAGLNVWYFHARIGSDWEHWDRQVPWRARIVGVLSLSLWLGIVVAGRWTAYF
jgi:hypothetical protein